MDYDIYWAGIQICDLRFYEVLKVLVLFHINYDCLSELNLKLIKWFQTGSRKLVINKHLKTEKRLQTYYRKILFI
jgi:hypothetical protein